MLGPIEDALAEAVSLPPAQRERLEVAHRSALRLLKLVNSLLDFSRIEAGRERARFQPINLAALTAALASNFRSACERAGLDLVVDCPPFDAPVYVDPDMWEKIVLNLLSNAFKFTLRGGVTVALREAAAVAELVVRDTGVGIPPHELPRLFERFHRIEGQRGRTHEGTGIGLALVDELVKMHGGSITASSVPDEGTEFRVTIPLGSAHLPRDSMCEPTSAFTQTRASAFVEEALRWLPDQAGGRPSHSPEEADLAQVEGKPRILLADDNADMRAYVAGILARGGYDIETAEDGAAALAAARRGPPPDLILTDVMMPLLDGFALLREVRADPAMEGLPVILLSARAGEEARIDGLAAGADDYLTKPFGARELRARIDGAIRLARLRRDAYSRIQAVNKELQEFAYAASHDLKAPLRVIDNTSRWLEEDLEGRLHEGTREHMRLLRSRVARMEKLLDDLLEYSRIGRVTDARFTETIAGQELIDDLIAMIAPPDGFEVRTGPGFADIRVCRMPLQHVLMNLIGNAIKHHDKKTGCIEVTVEDSGDFYAFAVKDDGPGIPAQFHEQIFKMFQTLKPKDQVEGSGMGLALVKKYVELYGGKVSLESEEGKGSAFRFTWPKAAGGVPSQTQTREAAA